MREGAGGSEGKRGVGGGGGKEREEEMKREGGQRMWS